MKQTQEVEEEIVEEDQEEDPSEAEEEEVEFYEEEIYNPKLKKKVIYLITDDEHRDIYEQDEEGQPTRKCGKLVGKNNKAHFF